MSLKELDDTMSFGKTARSGHTMQVLVIKPSDEYPVTAKQP